jgi:hypothetical protein
VELIVYTNDEQHGSWTMRVSLWKHKGSQAAVVCWQEFPLERVPSPAAIPFLNWNCVGNSMVRCKAGDREILLDIYAELMQQILRKLRPIDRSQTLDLPHVDE